MAKVYTSTVTVRCIKEHTCLCCGSVFQYPFERKVVGKGPKADQAELRAQKLADIELQTGADPHPCPTCGLYQPDMIGPKRRKTHLTVFWCALIALIVVMIIRLAYGFGPQTATWIALLLVAVAVAIHLLTDWRNPNANLTANVAKAQSEVAANKLKLIRGGSAASIDAQRAACPPRAFGQLLSLILLPLAIVCVLLPTLLLAVKGWPTNGETYPPVAGPGDTVRIYMGQKIESIKGYWRGTPHVTLTTHDGDGTPIPASATTNENNWGSTIYAKSSEKHSYSTPYVIVALPDRADLAGQSLDCDIELSVTYPASTGSGFEDHDETLNRSASFTLAKDARAGSTYDGTWWLGTLVGTGLLLTSGLLLSGAAKSFTRRATPSRALTTPQPQPAPPPVPAAPPLPRPAQG